MKIKNVTISNWRSIKSLDIEFQNMMVFIGQNNHGKSNILSSLLFFFGEIKHQDLDFNHGSTELYVEILFTGLNDEDKHTFKKYLTNQDEILVRKTAYLGGSFEYKGYIQNPVEGYLQEDKAGTFTKREIAECLPIYPYLPQAGRIKKEDVINAQNAFLKENEVEYRYELEETPFLGFKSVAKEIFGDIYFIPAIKDASEDFSTKEASAFGKLYSSVIDSMSQTNDEWRNAKSTILELFNTLNKNDHNGVKNDNRPKELSQFEKELSEELKYWGAEIDVEIAPPKLDDVFRANTQVWVNDGVKTDIRRKGHGLQRALTLALIKVISNKLKKDEEEGKEDRKKRATSKSTYFILEEPELYLHPQAQRALFDSLSELSESNNQVLICTHASALIDLEKYSSICIVRKESEEKGTEVCQFTGEIFPGDVKKHFNLAYWINPDRSELFFSKKVALVEGQTEKTLIPYLAKKLGVFRYDVTLIDCGAKTAIPLYARLLNKFSIPYVAVYDRDHQASKNQGAINAADRDTRLVEAEISADLGYSIVFENDFEEELGFIAGASSKPYVALNHINDDNYSIPQSLEDKIKSIYH